MPQLSTAPIRPEIELLLCCARAPSLPRSDRLAQLVAGPLDWDALIEHANENGLLPLVCERLSRNSNLQIPVEPSERLRNESRQLSARTLLLTRELLRITDALRQKQIRALAWKGPTLAQLAYGNPALRQFDDLDFVLPQKSIADVYAVMNSLGYAARFPLERVSSESIRGIPGEYTFVHQEHKTLVEFHTELTLRHFPRCPDLDGMLHRAITIAINGSEIQTFSPPDNLLMLCIHGAKDFWLRLAWVADVVSLSEKLDNAQWQHLFAEAERLGATRMVNLGLHLARIIFEAQLPADILRRLSQDRGAARVAVALRDQLLGIRDLPAGIVWRSRYRISMMPSVPRGIGYWLRLSTAPAEEDWRAGAAHSNFAYSLPRLLRLWRKYGFPGASQHLDSQDS